MEGNSPRPVVELLWPTGRIAKAPPGFDPAKPATGEQAGAMYWRYADSDGAWATLPLRGRREARLDD